MMKKNNGGNRFVVKTQKMVNYCSQQVVHLNKKRMNQKVVVLVVVDHNQKRMIVNMTTKKMTQRLVST